eukprot:CAMPEP_0184470564 /NCGR_PEP_ID=MMETSP0740-20130409/93451_1 /TAXON_ID=385413 /ORGANISM="Thalassiosira miniscula, Strain CCMP1093" /LENGTH=41 /DNA_ID= /DNA_START= /DNA_END= /DNA_ORIENTATION=
MKERAIVTDDGRFADRDVGCVVEHHAFAHRGGGMNIDRKKL